MDGNHDEKSSEWLEYQRIAEQVQQAVSGSQRKLKELEESSALKLIPQNPYEEEAAPRVDGGDESHSDWKPINEVLDEEIKRQRELMKPRRPPPPAKFANTVQTAANPVGGDDEWQRSIIPSWDDETAANYYTQAPTYQPPPVPSADVRAELAGGAESSARGDADGLASPNVEVDSSDSEREDKAGLYKWTAFNTFTELPQSESGFFSNRMDNQQMSMDPFAPLQTTGAPVITSKSDDPFEVMDAEQILQAARRDAEMQRMQEETQESLDLFKAEQGPRKEPTAGFEDSFAPEPRSSRSPSPLFEEDDSEPLQPFCQPQAEVEWNLYIRYPIKKRLVGERCWKPVYVRLISNKVLQVFNSRSDASPFQEFSLQPTYCLTAVCLQQYDAFGKIHATRLQHVVYKERVGIRPGQIPRLVEGQFTKLGMPLEHAAQTVHLIKFGSLDVRVLNDFVWSVEDALFKVPAKRMQPATYRQDEIQIHCYDEYIAEVDRVGLLKQQRARVRLFCLAFVNGMPWVEIGLNDRRRQGMEVVRRKDIMPMHTERWIRFEGCEFHSAVDQEAYDREHVIRLQPLDACFFEVFRFRVRPPKQRQLPLHVTAVMNIVGSRIEIRIECMVTGYSSRKAGQVPCEDIQIRFPIPEAWIYIFREERYWGYGSVHAKLRRPGKVKNIREKFMGMVQPLDVSLMEVAIGDAKYEHVYRSIVWRIPRLPEKNHEAYKTHLFKCRFELTSYDMMPDAFVPTCDIEFTMPIATVSNTVVRSVSVDQHEDPEHVEKWVRYLSKYNYTVDIDYIQSNELDINAVVDPTVVNPEDSLEQAVAAHRTEIDTNVAKELHEGYRVQSLPQEAEQVKPTDGEGMSERSSSEDEADQNGNSHFPVIQINAADYSY